MGWKDFVDGQSMLSSCSPLLFYFGFAAIILLPLGLAYRGYSQARHEGGGDFDRNAWLLVSLFIAALASMVVFVIYIFFHAVGC